MSTIIRIILCGHVDDGKSTLIGRLLLDSQAIHEDHKEEMQNRAQRRGLKEINLADLTDGLKAESEQGITIDVAYRYLSTPSNRLIIADAPGHVQYTRNMVTGASNADVAVILVDATKGLREQSYRHSAVASILGIEHIVVAVNKMDLLDYDQEAFDELRDSFSTYLESLGLKSAQFIPVSALRGDNVIERSDELSWFEGPTLMDLLASYGAQTGAPLTASRFPIQWIVRPSENNAYQRSYAGQIVSGDFSVQQEVALFPSGRRSRIRRIYHGDEEHTSLSAPASAAMELEDDLDAGRGEWIVPLSHHPTVTRDFSASVCWFAETPLQLGRKVLLKQSTRETPVKVAAVQEGLDFSKLQWCSQKTTMEANDIGRLRIVSANQLAFDNYHENRHTGSFILIDPQSHETLAAGMFQEATAEVQSA